VDWKKKNVGVKDCRVGEGDVYFCGKGRQLITAPTHKKKKVRGRVRTPPRRTNEADSGDVAQEVQKASKEIVGQLG